MSIVSSEIEATRDVMYALVSDVTRTGECSARPRLHREGAGRLNATKVASTSTVERHPRRGVGDEVCSAGQCVAGFGHS